MSHLLSTTNSGETAMAYIAQNGTPWHGLGTAIDGQATPEEILRAAKLDWRVEAKSLWFGDDKRPVKSGERCLVRIPGETDDFEQESLGIIGPDYVPFQNQDVFKFFKEFTDAGSMKMDTAGALKGNRQIWALASIQQGFKLAGGDDVNGYLLLSHPHELGKSLVAMFTPIRVVCNNTLTMALKHGGNQVRIRHVKEFDENVIEDAKAALGISTALMKEFQDQSEFLASRKANDTKAKEFVGRLFDKDIEKAWQEAKDAGRKLKMADMDQLFNDANRATKMVAEAIETQPGASLASSKGTWWGVLNAVTYAVDHKWGNDRDAALHNAWFGPRANLKRTALERALEYAKAA